MPTVGSTITRLHESAATVPAAERANTAHFEAQATWGAIYGTLLGVLTYWYSTDYAGSLLGQVDAALDRLGDGLDT